MADNIGKVREELRDDINVLEQEMLARVKLVRADTFQYMHSEIAQQNREIERLEDLIKQLSEDGAQTAPTKATHQPVPGISNAAVVAAVQADLQANDTRSTITNLGDVSEPARKKFLADFAKTNGIKNGPNIKRNAERIAVIEIRNKEETSTFREKWFKAVKSTSKTSSKPKINGKNVYLHP